jgi:malonate decarboxylase beta subunit
MIDYDPEMARSPLQQRQSFLELNARARAQTLLDTGTFRELLGPFERLESPWLEPQGIVPESDDGLIIARGLIQGHDAVVLAIESAFQGGSIGEVSGAKIAGALELALRDCEQGKYVYPVLSLETGGVRLQEANLGLNAIAEICAAIVALRRYVPVIGVVAGMVGSFGGMSIAAGLCSYLIVTREARLGLNGPEVIEQEAGLEEFDSADRSLIWSVDGGEQRYACGLVDFLVADDVSAIVTTIQECIRRGVPANHRSAQIDHYRALFADIDLTEQFDSIATQSIFRKADTR